MKDRLKKGLFHLSRATHESVSSVLYLVAATAVVVSTAYTMYGLMRLAEMLGAPSTLQVAPNLPIFGSVKNDPDAKASALLRLSTTVDNDFFCTGFVIDGQYALTAGHCLDNSFGRLRDDAITAKDAYNSPISVAVTAVALDSTRDVGLLKGDFRAFKAYSVDTSGELIYRAVDGSLHTCGFPSGSKYKYCSPYINTGFDYFSVTGIGLIFPGMSGGPVISASGIVVGVNSARDSEGRAVISTLTGVFASFGVEP
jgi:hypothetical protein